jgi:hypothetical protein
VVLLALKVAIWAYGRQPTASRKDNNATVATDKSRLISTTTIPTATTKKTNDDDHDPNDVWAQRRKQGIAAASFHGTKPELQTDQKPFGSSYYYAHNHSSAKGGYSDGLTMEDFTMNRPRLLSSPSSAFIASNNKENDTVRSAAGESTEADAIQTALTNTPVPVAPAVRGPPDKRVLTICKYLVDDPTDTTASPAVIRIDQLPGLISTADPVAWSTVTVAEVTAKITETKGLLVVVRTVTDTDKGSSSSCDYKLHIPVLKLHGEVVSVETVLKPGKRLLVKLHRR